MNYYVLNTIKYFEIKFEYNVAIYCKKIIEKLNYRPEKQFSLHSILHRRF